MLTEVSQDTRFESHISGWLEAMFNSLSCSSLKNSCYRQDTMIGFRDNSKMWYKASIVIETIQEDIFGKTTMQLISVDIDPSTNTGKRSQTVAIKKEKWILPSPEKYIAYFYVEKDFGTPGAFIIKNLHSLEFFLQSVTISSDRDGEVAQFPCYSWVDIDSKYSRSRIFFSNELYLPRYSPPGLVEEREQDLSSLRGDGTGDRKLWDRIYDYDTYNDLGNPDKSRDLQRPVLGGTDQFPYPRRCRTGRESTKSDERSESPLLSGDIGIYVPREERFDIIKEAEFLANVLKDSAQKVIPALQAHFDKADDEIDQPFSSFNELKAIYHQGIDISSVAVGILTGKHTLVKQFNERRLKYPVPQVIATKERAWIQDEEFSRQTLAGLNPLVIECLKVFPPRSKLDPDIYGPQESAIKAEHISSELEGHSIEQALEQKKLYILDYHDAYMPYLKKINALKGKKVYASRTLFYLREDGTLRPVAIELSSPSGSSSPSQRVFSVPAEGKLDLLWELAKAHVVTNDSGYHQLISHWLRTHAILEPFIIATRRQLSSMHPLNPFLLPHFKDTMLINARARQALIDSDGIIENSFSTGKYSMEMTSAVYKSWRFDEQGLPADLLKRGMAVPAPSSKHGLKLTIEDYPYAVDGLEIWDALQSWVSGYIDICYKDDTEVEQDSELQGWWNEIRTVGHGDKKEGWVELNSKENLTEVLTTLIWLASAHHAAVNFGQYAYGGYMPNHPTSTHKEVPELGSDEFKELVKDPESFFLSAVSTKLEATTVMTTIEILSSHASNEYYLGERKIKNWTSNERALSSFKRFSKRLKAVEDGIHSRNRMPELKNRVGLVNIPYTLLMPSSGPDITGRGIPNSTSI